MAALEEQHWWFAARREIIGAILTRHAALPPRSRILEIGCGTGGNLSMPAHLGSTFGCEPDPYACAVARSKGIAEIRSGSLPDDIPFERSAFDLVAALDVMEHVEEDSACLATLRMHLKPGGNLLITVPAFPFLWSSHDVLHHHKRRYTLKELLEKVAAARLTPLHRTYFNTTLFPIVAAVRTARNILGRPPRSDDSLPPRLVNEALKRIFTAERHLAPRLCLPAGSSLALLARVTP